MRRLPAGDAVRAGMPLSRPAGVFLDDPPVLAGAQPTILARDFAIAENRTPPRIVRRLGVEVIEAIFRFDTAVGSGLSVVRLLADDPARAWVLMTSLDEIEGHEETIGTRRPEIGRASCRERVYGLV